jgi:hypothetical protein
MQVPETDYGKRNDKAIRILLVRIGETNVANKTLGRKKIAFRAFQTVIGVH